MKRNRFLETAAVAVFAIAALAVSQAWASSNSLSNPVSLAVDSKGNLFVANLGSGDTNHGFVLAYNSKLVRLGSRDITTGLNAPDGVAFDSLDNLYVANYVGFVQEYDSTGKATSVITNGLLNPTGIAVDALDDVWVDNAQSYVSMYSPFGVSLGTSNPGVPLLSLGLGGEWYALGTTTVFYQYPVGEVLTNNGTAGEVGFGSNAAVTAVAFNKTTGLYYVAYLDGSGSGIVLSVNPYTTQTKVLVYPLSYIPSGLAVDNAHNRLFIANRYSNTVDVYNLKGVYRKTLH